MQKKVAIITPEFSKLQGDKGGGLASFLDKFIDLIKEHYEVHVICSSNLNNKKKINKIFIHNVKVKYLILKIIKYLNWPILNYLIYYPIQSYILNRYLKKTNINFDKFLFTNFEYVSLFQDKKIKSIIRLSSLDHLWFNLNFIEKKISKFFDYLIFKNSSQIWCNSVFLKRKINFFKKKTKIIPTFINYKFKKSLFKNKKEFILFVGTLNERKGISLVAKLFDNLSETTKLRFVVIGKDTKKNFKSQFNKYLANKKFSNKLTFFGPKNKSFIFKYIQNAKLVVVPSKIENAPNILQEVLFNNGIPLCSDNSSMEELLFNDRNYLFKNGNDKNFILKAKKLIFSKNKKHLKVLKKYKQKLLEKNKMKKLEYILDSI